MLHPIATPNIFRGYKSSQPTTTGNTAELSG